ncbi:hypothetical protein [Sporosarcina sp. JAI121]|uniref:hypothetical protein n=1 Tax=Sporosarcina sp. JAI121 TaxID=2723064 RepID=UPI0015CAB474|nr:hypothetical protein [Sporosarcina sp. JAI121]NYF25648.1 hypothetical protein [Sporosarcina sp. JAI121]
MQELFIKRTLIGFVLKVVGLVVISWGIIQGFVLMIQLYDPYANGMGLIGFIGIVATPGIYGILLIGFGEVIDLLQKIHDQNDSKAQVLQAVENNSSASANVSIPLFAEQEIKEFYSNQNIWIDSILPTKDRAIFIVKRNGRTDYIALGESTPKILTEEEIVNIFN